MEKRKELEIMNENLAVPAKNPDEVYPDPMFLGERIGEYIGVPAWDVPGIKEAEPFWGSSTVVLDREGTITEIRESPDNLVVLTTIFGCIPEDKEVLKPLLEAHGFEVFEY